MISKKDIIEKVGVLLKELTDKFEYISDSDKEVNPLEFQLFEINAAYFAEHANLLRKLEEEESRSRAEVEAHAEIHENVLEEVEHTELKNTEQITDAEEEEPQEEESQEKEPVLEEDPIIFTPVTRHEPVEEEVLDSQETVEEIAEPSNNAASSNNNFVSREDEQVKDQEESVPEHTKPQPDQEITHEVVIEEKTLNVPNERPMSLNERLSEQRKSMDAEKKHLESPRRIKDIKSGINLNDKLLFIKDLFNGYSLAYSEAIELLNRFESFEDADRFLKTNYAEKNNWDAKQASVEKLYAILRQRYS